MGGEFADFNRRFHLHHRLPKNVGELREGSNADVNALRVEGLQRPSRNWSRWASGGRCRVLEVDGRVERGVLMVVDGNGTSPETVEVQEERRKLVTEAAFLQYSSMLGKRACMTLVNLVVVEIPKGVEIILELAFTKCTNFSKATFPKTLKTIARSVFSGCSSLGETTTSMTLR